jgi:hypothetical protein
MSILKLPCFISGKAPMNYVQDNICLGELPKRLVIACADSDALNGTIGKNPFDFKHYKINFVALNVDVRASAK